MISSRFLIKTIFISVILSFSTSFVFAQSAKSTMKPLPFELGSVIENEKGIQFEYALEGGDDLKVGSEKINHKSFSILFRTLGSMARKYVKNASSSELNRYFLLMKWPQVLQPQKFELISEKGISILSVKVTDEMIQAWHHQLEDWKQNSKSPLQGFTLGLSESQFDYKKILRSKEGFRFCFSQVKDKNQSQLCSGFYGISRSKSGAMMRALKKRDQNVRILLNGEESKLRDIVTVEKNMVFRFFAEMSDGVSFEVTSKPPVVEVRNVQSDQSKYEVYIQDVTPVSTAVETSKEQYSKLTQMIGFESTIKDDRKIWKFGVDTTVPTIYILGPAGGVFRQDFTFNQMPKEDIRVYIDPSTPDGTYSSTPKVYGEKPADSTLFSSQKSIENKPGNRFVWKFNAPKNNDFNKSYLTVKKGDQEYKSYYEFFKGNSAELSYRLTITSGDNETKTMQEGAFNYFFEDLFGWNNALLSRLRWGLSLKYFEQLTGQLFASGGAVSNDFKVMVLDLKYRSPAGLWGRDEAVGFMLSYQDLTLGVEQLGMYGLGAFWARSMPDVFNRLFNYIPGMNFPKWVDMEYIQYLGSNNADMELGNNSALNFHGKVFWTSSFFGEAGFGIKQYQFTNRISQTQVSLSSFYATVGLGLSF